MIEFHQVTAYQQQTHVFDRLSLRIGPYERVAILGPNGAGKSTLLKLINRELYPVAQEGSYLKLFGSETIHLWQLREKIGFVSHDLQENYTPFTTALEVVVSGFFGAVGAYEHLQATDIQVERARETMRKVGIAQDEACLFQRLSTGQRRRLLLARALVHQPEALIFDEPANGLDLGASQTMLALLRSFCSEGRALIVTTHRLDEVIPDIDRVILINQGRVIADGQKADILTSKNLSELYQTKLNITEKNGWYRCWHD